MTQSFGSPSPTPPPVGPTPDAVGPAAPGVPDAVTAVPLSTPKFCNTCGEPWAPDWLACGRCTGRLGEAAGPVTAVTVAPNTPVTSAIALYFAFLGASVVMMIALLAGANSVTTDFIVSGGVSVMIMAWCLAFRREVAPALLRIGGAAWYPAAVGGAVATFTIASAALFVLGRVLGVPQLRYTDDFFSQGYGVATVIAMIAVQPAIFEELAFRGVIFSGLQHVLSPVEAVFVSALMFMIIHLSVASFPHLFVIGLALGWLRLRTGSLYPGMLLHFTHNLLCVVFEIWRPPLPW